MSILLRSKKRGERKSTVLVGNLSAASPRKAPIRIIPRFWMKGWRDLRPREEIKAGDFRWSRVEKCWLPAPKNKIGDLAGTVHTYARRESQND